MSRLERNLLTFVLLFFLGMFLGKEAHCTTVASQKNRSNAFGAVIYQRNPNSYLAGSVTEVFDIENEKGLVVRVQPISTYAQFTDDILFCGFPVDMLQGKENPMVLVWETTAHRTVNGVGCHRLVSVQEIKSRSGGVLWQNLNPQ